MALLDAVAGAAYVGRGLGTWRRRPGLMLLGAVPALLVALVVLGALVALLVNLGDLVAWATPFADAWAEAVRGLLRVGLAVLVVMTAVATLSGIRVEPPQVFVVLSYLSLVVEVAILVTMFHPDTDRYLSATHDRIAAS